MEVLPGPRYLLTHPLCYSALESIEASRWLGWKETTGCNSRGQQWKLMNGLIRLDYPKHIYVGATFSEKRSHKE